MDLAGAIWTDHAREQAAARQVGEASVRDALAKPDQVRQVRPGRVVAQRVIGDYLIRVFVDVDREPAELVTVYRTSKISKYRSP